jgi:hypothetical protein
MGSTREGATDGLARMIGCAHNASRVLNYGPRSKRLSYITTYTTYREGDWIELRCPYGCVPIVLTVRSTRHETNRHETNEKRIEVSHA